MIVGAASLAWVSIRGDLGDIDDVELERSGAGVPDRVGPKAADQPEPPVDRAHPGPGQRDLQHRAA